MSLLQKFQQNIKHHHLFSPKDKLLLAVSGGVDSIVLCELCKQAGFNFIIVHCNFQLRGEESGRDEKFVQELGKKYGAEVVVKKFDTEKFAKENKLSVQEAARALRYNWFKELMNRIIDPPINCILTAHHLGDNIETMLMNFFKGTGIAGLRGMLPKQGKLIRPLLFAKKEEVLVFAKENNLNWVEDSSNRESKYSRNYFRNEIIPLIKKIYPEAENNLTDNLRRFADIEMLYKQAIDQHKKKLLEQKGNEVQIPVLKLKKSEPLHSIVYEIIKDYGFSPHQTDEVIDLLDSESGKYIQSATHRVIKNRNWLIIASVMTEQAETILIDKGDRNVQCSPEPSGFNVQLSIHDTSRLQPDLTKVSAGIAQTSNNTAHLDADEISFPLLLRKWKQGDYFYPLGMKKKKKLSRFFIDQKLSKTDKEKVWVIESDKKILWIAGYRIDERFKVTEKTKSVLKITIRETE
jgi:tRNA(Ile)-lysidine synthase